MNFLVSDNMKVGILMTGLGVLFLLLGVVLLFDSGLLAIGNVLFLTGIALIIGVRECGKFFSPFRKGRTRGVVCFFLGVLLVLLRWPVVGMAVELIGFVEMFGKVLPMVVDTLRRLPVIGPCLRLPGVEWAVDKIVGAAGGKMRPRNSFA